MNWTVKAEYHEQILPEYQGNPLIEALPDIFSVSDTMKKLTRKPRYDDREREWDAKYRIHCLSRILHEYYQPLPQHFDIEMRISVCLRQGYLNRNPAGRQYALMVNESYEAMKEKRQIRHVPGYHPNASGFTIIGVSGVGKSTAVESVLNLYPQVIRHTQYRGEPFPVTQIVWLKLDCPHEGSRGELCYQFFRAVDACVGTSYLDQYKKSRITIDSMLTLMARIAQEYSLGLLVVDEVQHLSLAKGGADAMLNFFVTLVNTIGLPVVLIGTSKALPILQGEFRQARRSSGHGDLIWNRMKKEKSWAMFVGSIWKYQWIRNAVALTTEMMDIIYEETQGIIVLAVILYVLLQEDAILSERETFGAEDIHRVAVNKMGLVQPMLEALRRNDQKLIDQYEDITDILMDKVEEGLWSDQPAAGTGSSLSAKTMDKLRDIVLPFFTAMGVPPEKTERYLEQVYRETKSQDAKIVISRVYELVNRGEEQESEETGETAENDLREGQNDRTLEEKGLLDREKW